MKKIIINDTYDRITKILKNDQRYSYAKISALILQCVESIHDINHYYEQYPPLLDVIELSASIGYPGSGHQAELMQQIRYKMQELRHILPDLD